MKQQAEALARPLYKFAVSRVRAAELWTSRRVPLMTGSAVG
jgi:hypothetical protein